MSINGRARGLGSLEVLGTIEERCISNNTKELTDFILQNFVVDTGETALGIIISNITPGPDQRGNLWLRTDNNNNFLGFFLFNGQTRQWEARGAFPSPETRIYWKFDPTQEGGDIPPGYIIDEDPLVAGDIRRDDQERICYAWIHSTSARR